MPNSKTTPPAPKPVERNGWIRKSDLDAWLGRYLPIPTQAVSNEEFFPIPQTPEQKRLEHEIFAGAEREARLAGTDRRKFLRSSCGMALAFAALNAVYGKCFHVDAAELSDPAAVVANKTRFFILTSRRITWPCPKRSRMRIRSSYRASSACARRPAR